MRELAPLRLADPGPPVTDANLAVFELVVGGRLPADYAAFLRQSNGGCVDGCTFALPDGAVAGVTGFYRLGMEPDDPEDLLWAYDRCHSRLDRGVIPVAYGGDHTRICLDLRPGAGMQVLIWRPEADAGPRPAAVSFTRWLAQLS